MGLENLNYMDQDKMFSTHNLFSEDGTKQLMNM